MVLAEVYPAVRGRLLQLAESLDEQQLATVVPAAPEWTVRDVYAHLSGVCADFLTGRVEGAPGPQWTAHQVASRKDLPFSGVCREWSDNGPQLDEALRSATSGLLFVLPADAWHHEQDLRGALGLTGTPAPEESLAVLTYFAKGLRRRWDGLPPLRIVGDTQTWEVGDGEPVATLRATDFELARQLVGRRSRAQLEAMDWTGDPTPFLDRLNVFGPPDTDLLH